MEKSLGSVPKQVARKSYTWSMGFALTGNPLHSVTRRDIREVGPRATVSHLLHFGVICGAIAWFVFIIPPVLRNGVLWMVAMFIVPRLSLWLVYCLISKAVTKYEYAKAQDVVVHQQVVTILRARLSTHA